jgi:hypothetical protein
MKNYFMGKPMEKLLGDTPVWRRMAGWLTSGALGLEASNRCLSRHFSGRTQKDKKKEKWSVSGADVTHPILQLYIPQTQPSLWPYGYSNWLVNTTFMN